MFQHRPAVRFVLLFAVGILLATWISFPPVFSFFLTLIFILFSAILIWIDTWYFVVTVLLQCSIVLLGFLLQTLQQDDFRSHKLQPSVIDESLTIFGTVNSEPTVQERRLSCIIQVDSTIRYGKGERDSRRVMVLLRFEKGDHYTGEIGFGKRVRVQGTLEPFPFQRNPGEFDYGKYLLLNDIQGVISTKGLHKIEIEVPENVNTFDAWIYSTQHALFNILDSFHSPRQSSFLKGIILGYRAEISSDVKQSFMDTGTIHILAVSGSNVAFVAFVFYSVLGLFRFSRKIIGGISMLGLIAYMLITGMSASVIRATVMGIVLLCGTLFEKKVDIYNSISVAALILLLWKTNTLFDVGFQLSFAAVISIVYFYPRLELLIKKIPERFEEIKIVDNVLKLFAVSLAAQLGTIPFTAYYFGRVSIVSLLANIIVVPMSGLNTFIGVAEIVFSFVSRWIASLYATVNDFLVWFLLGFVKQAASIPFAYLETWHLSSVSVAGYYLIVLGVFNINRARVRVWMIILLLTFGNYVLFTDIWSLRYPKLGVTAIDIGQGDAILLEFPNRKHLLIDAGPSSQKFDSGERTIVPFLKRKGINKLDYFLITHTDNDHFGGAKSVLKSMKVDTFVMTPLGFISHSSKKVLDIAHSSNVGTKALLRGNQIPIDSSTRIYVMNPDIDQLSEKNLNNTSLVLRVVFGGSSILLVGDAETVAEQKMCARYRMFLSSDVLKVGHHGSMTSTSDEFLRVVRPKTAIISVGNHNRFGHPSPSTLARLMAHSVEIDRTDKAGAIVWESDGTRWTRREWR